MRAEDWIRPYGELPASTYWLRRAIALVILVVILVIIWPSGGGTKTPTAGSSSHLHPSASPSPVATAQPCIDKQLIVEANANALQYPAGSNPRITISIKDISSSSCVVDTSKRYLTIVSGSDLWWSSAACPAGTQPKITIAAGQSLTSTYVWTRIRQAHSCAINGTAQPGTYLAQAHLGDIQTPGAILRLE